MADKPTGINWGTSNIIEPSGGKKATGWISGEKPAYQFFNWIFNKLTNIQDYLGGVAEPNIIISLDSNEQDYASMADYIADSPSAGDIVLIKANEEISAPMAFPADITVKQIDGVALSTPSDLASFITLGDNTHIEGTLKISLSHTGTLVSGVVFDGDNSSCENVAINNASTGTITNAFIVNASKTANLANGSVVNPGGTVTNLITDNSTNTSNGILVASATAINRSNGLKTFANGISFDLGSDANGDDYQRTAGALAIRAIGGADTLSSSNGSQKIWRAVKDALILGSDAIGDLITRNGSDAIRLASGLGVLVKDNATSLLEWTGATAGDLFYWGASDMQRLAVGSDGQVLTLVSGAPAWQAIGRAYYSGNVDGLLAADTWTDLTGGDFDKIDWRGKIVQVTVMDASPDPGTWLEPSEVGGSQRTMSFGEVPAADGVVVIGDSPKAIELRALAASSGKLQVRRPAAQNDDYYFVMVMLYG